MNKQKILRFLAGFGFPILTLLVFAIYIAVSTLDPGPSQKEWPQFFQDHHCRLVGVAVMNEVQCDNGIYWK